MSKDKVVFLDEEEGVVSEIKLELMVALIRMMDSKGKSAKVDDYISEHDPVVIVPIEFANLVKKFILENELSDDRLGKLVLLSAHCPCRGKGPEMPL